MQAAVTLVGKDGVDAALLRGDAAAVEALVREGKVGKLTAEFSRAVLTLDLDKLQSTLAACRDVAYAAGGYGPAASCGMRLAGAAELMGDPQAFADGMAWLQEKGLPGLHSAFPQAPLSLGDGLDASKFSEISKVAPALEVTMGDASDSLAVTKFATGGGWVPLVKIRVNGQELMAQLDTGASSTLIFDRREARRLGLTPLVDSVTILKSSYTDSQYRQLGDGYFVANSVEFGPLSAANYMVVVTDRLLPHPVIGSNLLARFDRVSIGADEVVLNPDRPAGCSAQSDTTFASFGNMHGIFVFPASVGDRQVNFSLDTGSDTELLLLGNSAVAYEQLPLQKAVFSEGGIAHGITFRAASVTATMAGEDIGPLRTRVLGVAANSAEGFLGAPFLDRYTVTQDMRASTICLTRRSAPPAS